MVMRTDWSQHGLHEYEHRVTCRPIRCREVQFERISKVFYMQYKTTPKNVKSLQKITGWWPAFQSVHWLILIESKPVLDIEAVILEMEGKLRRIVLTDIQLIDHYIIFQFSQHENYVLVKASYNFSKMFKNKMLPKVVADLLRRSVPK